MSKNIILNGETFNNASYIETETADGGTALFRDTSEIVTPSGSMEITENGTFDVTNFAQALVNVAGGGGAIQPITGFYEMKARTALGVDLPIGEVNASKFLVFIQLVKTGTYATKQDATSELTMDDVVTGFGTDFMLYSGTYLSSLYDDSVEYELNIDKPYGIKCALHATSKTISVFSVSDTMSYSNGVLSVTNTGYYSGNLNKYCKYAYTVYPLG